jgi:signal peptidase I
MHSDVTGDQPPLPVPGPEGDEPVEPAGRARTRTRNLVEWVVVVLGALAIAVVIQLTSLQAFRIPSESMLPLLEKGDRVLVNKWSYRIHDVKRGDVVVFSRPPGLTDTTVDDLIKRVVGLPGDSISIADGHVSVNGEVLDEPYLAPGATTQASGPVTCPPADPCVIPDGKVWVMGDNRNFSEDSRWFGPIAESSIVGRAFVRLWPLGRIGGL